MQDGTSLETAQSEKKIWLVKFPSAVSERIHALAAQPNAAAEVQALGIVRSVQNADQRSDSFKLELNDAAFPNIPTAYAMRTNESNADSAYCICSDDSRHAVEGHVAQRLSVGMLNEDRAQAQGDPRYRSLTRERKERAATKTRVMQMIDDPRGLNIRALPKVTTQKKTAPISDTRRVRMERDQLENLLFALFERQPAWPFIALEKETNQPIPWLKEVLNGIAIMVRTAGGNQNKWVLKKDFQT